ncbi:unnamed protein product [Cylindrotheca closterium]|uniref:Helicase-associated domain-containing protein n=1 Tax=Cylindrotheca closterium TaxID=2856 RepID=A0AAD2JNL1_9STRA|nr:unnamed protein product [Cylindrotheca closterium]
MAFLQNNVNAMNSNASFNSSLRMYVEMIEACTALEQQKLLQNLRHQLAPTPPAPTGVAAMPNNTHAISPLLVAEAFNTLIKHQQQQQQQQQQQVNANPLVLALAAAANQPAALASALTQALVNPVGSPAPSVHGILNALTRQHPSVSTTSSASSPLPQSPAGILQSPYPAAAISGMVFHQSEVVAKRPVSDISSSDDSSGSHPKRQRLACSYEKDTSFLHYHDEKWNFHYNELVEFKTKHGHCNVPYGFEENKALSRWVKRQRYQYKQKREGKTQAMPESRIRKLDQLGFVWGAQELLWQTRFHELKEYKLKTGHCNVPYIHDPNPKLAIWVKCQRRQYKLSQEGKPSNMTVCRIKALADLGFVWTQRKPLR